MTVSNGECNCDLQSPNSSLTGPSAAKVFGPQHVDATPLICLRISLWCVLRCSLVCVCARASECVLRMRRSERLIFCQAFPNKNTSFLITSALSASASAGRKEPERRFQRDGGKQKRRLSASCSAFHYIESGAREKNAQNSATPRAINLISTFALLHLFSLSHTH